MTIRKREDDFGRIAEVLRSIEPVLIRTTLMIFLLIEVVRAIMRAVGDFR